MRAVRAENLRHVKDIATLTEKHTEAKRKVDLAESSEAALKTQLKSAEAAARGLKEEMVRTKALVSQARASCATEVRRRDRQIDSLKKQLGEAGRARGSRPNPAITTIHVTGDTGSKRSTPTKTSSITSTDYSLRNETNAFLANLAQNLSEENEAILKAMQRTMSQLREMSGWNSDMDLDAEVHRQPSWEEMASELDSVLEHMKTILTNPSFVPIEEVMVREEEIVRLKDGWVKMEDRWQDAMGLIDSWRKQMATTGRPVNEEDLLMGLRLSPVKMKDAHPRIDFGLSAVAEEDEEEEEATFDSRAGSPCPSDSGSLHLMPAEDSIPYEGEVRSNDGLRDEHLLAEDYEMESSAPNVEVLEESLDSVNADRSLASSPLPDPPQLSPLRNSNTAGNRGVLLNPKLRKPRIDFAAMDRQDRHQQESSARKEASQRRKETTGQEPTIFSSKRVEMDAPQRTASSNSLDEVLLVKSPAESASDARGPSEPESIPQDREHLGLKDTPRRGGSKLPLPRNPEPQQSPLTMSTIAAKLAASEKEADAARVRAKLRAARAARTVQKTTLDPPAGDELATAEKPGIPEPDVDPVKRAREPQDEDEGEQQPKPEKRKRERRTSKAAASRRRSTLSPLELQNLISGNVQ